MTNLDNQIKNHPAAPFSYHAAQQVITEAFPKALHMCEEDVASAMSKSEKTLLVDTLTEIALRIIDEGMINQ